MKKHEAKVRSYEAEANGDECSKFSLKIEVKTELLEGLTMGLREQMGLNI